MRSRSSIKNTTDAQNRQTLIKSFFSPTKSVEIDENSELTAKLSQLYWTRDTNKIHNRGHKLLIENLCSFGEEMSDFLKDLERDEEQERMPLFEIFASEDH